MVTKEYEVSLLGALIHLCWMMLVWLVKAIIHIVWWTVVIIRHWRQELINQRGDYEQYI